MFIIMDKCPSSNHQFPERSSSVANVPAVDGSAQPHLGFKMDAEVGWKDWRTRWRRKKKKKKQMRPKKVEKKLGFLFEASWLSI